MISKIPPARMAEAAAVYMREHLPACIYVRPPVTAVRLQHDSWEHIWCCCPKQSMSCSTSAIKKNSLHQLVFFQDLLSETLAKGPTLWNRGAPPSFPITASSSPTTELFRDWTYELTHNTTMFFHRFLVPTTFTMQTFFGLLVISFSSSETNQIKIIISLRRTRKRSFACELQIFWGMLWRAGHYR